jgi:hypothetical protein
LSVFCLFALLVAFGLLSPMKQPPRVV